MPEVAGNEGPTAGIDGGQGALVLIVGPSGVGKDTLLNAARVHFAGDERFAFPHRVITRADMVGEEHRFVSRSQFAAMENAGKFLISWQAHGFGYGIPISVTGDLARGRTVVINTSRRMIHAAHCAWPHVGVIRVSAGPAALRDRLRQRGREDAGEIEERLKRTTSVSLPANVRCDDLDNSGELEHSIARFTALLESYAAKG